MAARSCLPRASCTWQWPDSVKLHRQVSTQMAASSPARWRIWPQRGADELGGEVAVGLVRGHGEQQELAHAGGQVLVELGE